MAGELAGKDFEIAEGAVQSRHNAGHHDGCVVQIVV